MFFANYSGVYIMHSLETGIIVSIAAFFFFYFFTFTFERENKITKEISNKVKIEASEYDETGKSKYIPTTINNIIDIIIKESEKYGKE